MARRASRGLIRTAALAMAIGAAACTRAQQVDRAIEGVERSLEQALSYGAYYCAPRELALARAHLEFARVDLEQGDPRSAAGHVSEAALNARAAERLSPQARCAAASPGVSELPRTDGPDRDADGVEDSADACPDQAEDGDGYLDADGCPELDNDQDGRPDSLESCPNQAEDIDGFRDEDGCPDLDNDGDGVDDAIDRCPQRRGSAESEGCPREHYDNVEITKTALRIAEPVAFDPDTAVIRSVSIPVLDAVIAALQEHPEIRIEVQAHTDSVADDQHNLRLSQARAEAVRRYLVEHGIDASRLTALGYGETRPMESNRTSQGREINQRVEFVRIDSTP
jgi:OmpA-OmpF porin, OOP family